MASITTIEGQNIFDIALMTYGDISGAIQLLKDNEHINMNSKINSGTVINYTEQPNAFVDFVTNKNITIATDDDTVQTGRGFDSGFDSGFK